MRVLVTGASGFVGRALVQRLEADGREVVVPPTSWRAPERPPPELLRGIDAVAHLAAYLPSDYGDPSEAARCLQVNALGTLELLLAGSEAGVPHAVVVSSGNLYAPAERVDEESLAYPASRASYYLASKLCGEVWAMHLDERRLIDVSVLRPSAIYGAGMKGGVVRLFADRLRTGQPIRLDDGGRHRVDLVHVDDVVDAIIAAIDHRARGIFNVGSGVTTAVSELAWALVELEGADPALVVVEPAGEGAPSGFAALDITKATRTLGYRPTALREGLARMLS